MFSKELENLIQATLEDGILEDYEKTALMKRAEAEGVDLAELEIYINSIMQKRKRELREKEEKREENLQKEKKEAFGRVCPNCGKQVPPLTLKCDCGFEFTSNKAISSFKLLSDKINSLSAETYSYNKKEQLSKQLDLITTFPVPNTKEDINEFLSMSVSFANKKLGFFEKKKNILLLSIIGSVLSLPLILLEGLGALLIIGIWIGFTSFPFKEERIKNAWSSKFEQVMIKGRSLRGDPEFTQQLDYYEQLYKEGR